MAPYSLQLRRLPFCKFDYMSPQPWKWPGPVQALLLWHHWLHSSLASGSWHCLTPLVNSICERRPGLPFLNHAITQIPWTNKGRGWNFLELATLKVGTALKSSALDFHNSLGGCVLGSLLSPAWHCSVSCAFSTLHVTAFYCIMVWLSC